MMNPTTKTTNTLRPSCALPKAYKLPSLGSGMNIALKKKNQNIKCYTKKQSHLTKCKYTLQLAFNLCLLQNLQDCPYPGRR